MHKASASGSESWGPPGPLKSPSVPVLSLELELGVGHDSPRVRSFSPEDWNGHRTARTRPGSNAHQILMGAQVS